MKRQAIEWGGEIFANHILRKDQFQNYKELSKFNSKKQTQLESGQKSWTLH